MGGWLSEMGFEWNMTKRYILLIGLVMIILLSCSCPTLPHLTPSPFASTPSADTPSVTVYPQTPTTEPPPTISTSDLPFTVEWDDRELFRNNLLDFEQSILGELSGVSIYHLAISFSDTPNVAIGVEQVQYTNNEAVDLSEVDFAIFAEILGGQIEVKNVRVDDESITPDFVAGVMRVPLPYVIHPGESVLIKMEFTVVIPSRGGNFYYGIFGYNQNILSFAHAYPTILVYDQDGWNDALPDLDGDPLFVDSSFYLVSVNAPADLTLVASGVEMDRQEIGGRQIVLYVDGPARDFYLAAGQGFNKSSLNLNGVIVNSYYKSGNESSGQQALTVAARAISIFNVLYGLYPYREFDIVPIATDAGGVEYPGMTAIALDNYGGDETDWTETVVAHEVAHQWFYNLVGNDNQDQPWLDESLAEFATWEYYRVQYGSARAVSFAQDQTAWWQSADDPSAPIGLPVSAYSSYDYGAIVYGRGPLFFDALRNTLGQTTFDKFMQEYVQKYAWSIAYADDFKSLAEQHCGCDLTSLFDEWVYP
jgi:hypothetical protein